MSKLAILIPTTPDRAELLDRLAIQLQKQMFKENAQDAVKLFINMDNKQKTTGFKRNELVQLAFYEGYEYVAHFDSDDIPGETYIKRQLEVVESGMDCGELWGNIYFAGVKGKPFHHSIIYDKWDENKSCYKRTPNHLNCIRTEIANQFLFPDQVFGEDGKQSESMAAAGALKTMYPIHDVIYHYFTGNRETELEQQIIKELIK